MGEEVVFFGEEEAHLFEFSGHFGLVGETEDTRELTHSLVRLQPRDKLRCDRRINPDDVKIITPAVVMRGVIFFMTEPRLVNRVERPVILIVI